MKIDVLPFPSTNSEKIYHNKTVIVVDVLRTTTSMVEALQNGASQIIPARDVTEAMAFTGHLGRNESLLAGERGGVKLTDFNLGNSPFEFGETAVKNKSIVMYTSNGTGAILAAKNARELYLGCLRNRLAASKVAAQAKNDLIILCAGTDGECSSDDVIASGGILQGVLDEIGCENEISDFGYMALWLYKDWIDGKIDLMNILHYRRLKQLGCEQDLQHCFEQDKTLCVPKYENGSIRL